MIYEMETSEFYLCQKIINPKGHLEVKSIISGNNPGRVFVDSRTEPTSGLIWLGNLDGFVLIGDHDNTSFNQEVKLYFDETIIPQAIELGLQYIECFGNTNEWNEAIEQIFADRSLEVSTQHVYKLVDEASEGSRGNQSKSVIDDGNYTLCKITKEIYSASPFVQNKISEFWPDVDDFFAKGFGICLQDKDDVVSICYSAFIFDQAHGIDIETKQEYRRMKLGQRVAQAFLDECLVKKIEPYWDCMEANAPSIAVAERIGLTKEFSYRLYEFSIAR